jgi:hypothetical protein
MSTKRILGLLKKRDMYATKGTLIIPNHIAVQGTYWKKIIKTEVTLVEIELILFLNLL